MVEKQDKTYVIPAMRVVVAVLPDTKLWIQEAGDGYWCNSNSRLHEVEEKLKRRYGVKHVE